MKLNQRCMRILLETAYASCSYFHSAAVSGCAHTFVCGAMLGGSIFSNSPVVLTWSAAALKSKDKNRELCAHLSLCFQMEGGSFLQLKPPDVIRVLCMCVVWVGMCLPSPWTCSTWSLLQWHCLCEPAIISFFSAVRLKDFNIISLFLDGFVLFLWANLWWKLSQWVAHLWVMIFLFVPLLVISLTKMTR